MNLAIGHARNATLPLLLAATLSTGCATTFIKQVPNTPESAATPTLLSGYTVQKVAQSNEETNLLDSVVDATQNAQLEEFGQKAYAKLAEQMAERGFVLELEATRARSLDVIQVDGGAALAAGGGRPDRQLAVRRTNVAGQHVRGDLHVARGEVLPGQG